MVQFSIKIHIKSFETSTLQMTKAQIERICSTLLLEKQNSSASLIVDSLLANRQQGVAEKRENNGFAFYTSFPSSEKKLTVLRSPHIDKKSREQFQRHVYKSQISVFSGNREIPSLLLFLLKNSEFPGVQLKIASKFSTPFYW
jgi:ribosomal protein S10